MNRQQMKDFIALNVEQQRDEGAINLSPLCSALMIWRTLRHFCRLNRISPLNPWRHE